MCRIISPLAKRRRSVTIPLICRHLESVTRICRTHSSTVSSLAYGYDLSSINHILDIDSKSLRRFTVRRRSQRFHEDITFFKEYTNASLTVNLNSKVIRTKWFPHTISYSNTDQWYGYILPKFDLSRRTEEVCIVTIVSVMTVSLCRSADEQSSVDTNQEP